MEGRRDEGVTLVVKEFVCPSCMYQGPASQDMAEYWLLMGVREWLCGTISVRSQQCICMYVCIKFSGEGGCYTDLKILQAKILQVKL